MADKSLDFNTLRQALEQIYSQKAESSGGSVTKKKVPQSQCDHIPSTTATEEVQSEDIVQQVVVQAGIIPVPPPLPDASTKVITSTVLNKIKLKDKMEHQGEQSERVKHIRKPGMMALPPPPTEDALKKARATLSKVPTNIATSIKLNLKEQQIKTSLRPIRDSVVTKTTKFERVNPTGIKEGNNPKAAMLKAIPPPILENNKGIFQKPQLRKTHLKEVNVSLAQTIETVCEKVPEKEQMTPVDLKCLIPIPPPLPIEKSQPELMTSQQHELLLKSSQLNEMNQTSDQSHCKDMQKEEEVLIIPIPSPEKANLELMIATQQDLPESSDAKIAKTSNKDDYETLFEEIPKEKEESTPLQINIPIPPPLPVETPKLEIIKPQLNELPNISDDSTEQDVATVEIINKEENGDIITNEAIISVLPSLVMETSSSSIDDTILPIHPPLVMVATTSSAIDDVPPLIENALQQSSSIDVIISKKVQKERRRSTRLKSRDTTRTSLKYKRKQKHSVGTMNVKKQESTGTSSESVPPKKIKKVKNFLKKMFH